MRFLASSADLCPSTDSSPESGNKIDIIIRIVVVLPAPFGPMKPYRAPLGITKSRSVTAFVAPNVLHTLLSRIASVMAVEFTPLRMTNVDELVAIDVHVHLEHAGPLT